MNRPLVLLLAAAAAALIVLGTSAPAWLGAAAFAAAVAILAALDALARSRAERSLRARLAALDRVVERNPLAVLDLDEAGAIVAVFGPSALLPDPPPRRFADLAAEPRILEEALTRARGCERLELFFDLAGGGRTLAATIEPRRGGFLAVLRDESPTSARERELSAALAEARAQSEGKSRFLANMSHELRTPLNAIVGFSDIMRAEMFGSLTPKYREYAELIHESGGHLLELVNDILDLSKIEAQRFELAVDTFDAREAVSAALRLVRVQADQANVRLRGLLPSQPVAVEADRRALKQIVLNLLANALKFTQSGGQAKVMLAARDGALELIVADTGTGISATDLERLGKPFEQAGDARQRAQGSGLGLSLVRALAALHGGAMTIESALGEGTVVTVRLPVLEGTKAAAPSAETAPPKATTPAPRIDNVIPFSPERRAGR